MRTARRAAIGALLACMIAIGPAARALPRVTPSIRVVVFQFVDRSRTIRLPGGKRAPRRLDTVVRYPEIGGPYPLVVFGHGFALTPDTYAALLSFWAAAGYVVAAPAFPLGNANAPGGPSENDLVNQPRDMSFVITQLLADDARASGVLHGKFDPARIAVAGHSDGAVTALAVAYDRRFRDPRVGAAVILSGATLGGMGAFPRRGPPLLAAQGTADPINPPSATADYFAQARRPKFLLWLRGASHLPPYTTDQPYLRVVEGVTTAFLDHYLGGGPLGAIAATARPATLARLVADP